MLRKARETVDRRMRSIRIFVSYTHDDRRHKENVRKVAEILRDEGFDVFLDRWNKTPRLDWNLTVTNNIREADFVLAVASPSYKRAAEGQSPEGRNLGAQHELAIIRELLNSNRNAWLPKIIPLILPGWTIDEVPTVLQPTTANHCKVDDISEEGVVELVELLRVHQNSVPQRQFSNVATGSRPALHRKLASVFSGQSTLAIFTVAVAALISGTIMLESNGVPNRKTTISGTGNIVNQESGACGQVINSSCVIQLPGNLDELSKNSPTDDELKQKLAQDATEDPASVGHGPWPFMVVDTLVNGVDEGMVARTTNVIKGDRIGTAANRSVVWADCIATTGFNPPTISLTDVGPLWLNIRWAPTENAPLARSVSNPTEPRRAWMYRGGVVPIDHNGNIPTCS